jgi:4-amino-4-deoxy-L-arabinose transferase-like glycosyltransferase
MLAAVFVIFGRSLVAVRIVQCLLCALTCVMVYFTAKEVTNERVAGIASLIFGFYPNSILYSARTLSETTYFFILSIFCLALVRQFKAPSVQTSIASGLSFGMLMLTKSITMLLPPFLALVLLSADYRKRLWPAMVCIIAMMLVAALVLSPWVIRNYRLTGRIILSSTWGGTPFYQGYYFATHLSDGRSGLQLDHDAGQEARRLVRERYTPSGQPIDEYHQDRIAYSLVWERVTTRPLYSFWIFLRNICLAWFLTYGRTTTLVSIFVHVPLLMLAAYAVFAMLRQDRDAWNRVLPLVLICAYFNLLYAVMYPHVRYMSPAIGTIVTIFAAYAISRLISWGRPS